MAAKIRLINDNFALRSTITAGSVAAGYSANNLTSFAKSSSLRFGGVTSQTLLVGFPQTETVSCIALPISNLTTSASITATVYSAVGGTGVLYSTGALTPVAKPATYPNWNTAPNNGNGFAYGNQTYAVIWIPPTASARSVGLVITDSANPDGFIELSNIVVGNYTELGRNPVLGINVKPATSSTPYRNAAGDPKTSRGVIWKEMDFDLTQLTLAERKVFYSILFKNGIDFPIFASIFPNDADREKEYEYTIYGLLTPSSGLKMKSCSLSALSVSLAEV